MPLAAPPRQSANSLNETTKTTWTEKPQSHSPSSPSSKLYRQVQRTLRSLSWRQARLSKCSPPKTSSSMSRQLKPRSKKSKRRRSPEVGQLRLQAPPVCPHDRPEKARVSIDATQCLEISISLHSDGRPGAMPIRIDMRAVAKCHSQSSA